MYNLKLAPWPSFSAEEANAVSSVLLSNKVNYWTGTEGRKFETEFAQWTGSDFAIAVANGTVALDLALHGLGIGERNGGSASDEVVVSPRTFIASVSCVLNAGARPVFADVDKDSGNIEAHTIEEVLTEKTKAVIAVHLAGWPVDMDSLNHLLRGKGVFVIEDCAQAHGAVYKGRPVGSLGDVAAWSFCQDKIMTTGGEGGMVTCSNKELWLKMWAFKDHGKDWAKVYSEKHPPGFRWLHSSIGTNWRLTEMQSAIGRIQLTKMGDWSRKRQENAQIISDTLIPLADRHGHIRIPTIKNSSAEKYTKHAYYKYYFYVNPSQLRKSWNRDRIIQEINKRGIPAFQGSCSEVYLEEAFEGSGCRPKQNLPTAKELGDTSIMLLVHPTIERGQMQYISTEIHEIMCMSAE